MLRRLLVMLCVCIAAASAVPAAAQPAARVALVIGNGAYRAGVPQLPNPPRDATAIARALERLGFQVDLLLDADLETMRAGIRRLADAADGAEAALLFYAGHAAEVDGQNLLFPVSLTLGGDGAALTAASIRYNEVAAALEGKAATTLIFLDACRDNPFTAAAEAAAPATAPAAAPAAAPPAASSRSIGHGLASVSSPQGTLIAFSTAPGQVALDGNRDNSPFTRALLRHIETPDIELRDMLTRVRRAVREETEGRQVPWDNSSLYGPFFMRVASAATRSAGPTRRIVDEAAAQGIPLPPNLTELRFQRPADATGPNAQLIGSWSSSSRLWGGRVGRRLILIVLSVNEANRTADVIFGLSAFQRVAAAAAEPAEAGQEQQGGSGRFVRRSIALTAAGTIEMEMQNGQRARFILTGDDTLTAVQLGVPGRGAIRMRLDRAD